MEQRPEASIQQSALSIQPGESLGNPMRLDLAKDADIRKLLERLARKPFEKCEREWRALLRELRLGLIYAVPMGEVLREGRWRETKNPIGYVRQAGVRRAMRLGLVDRSRRRPRWEALASDLNYRGWDAEEPSGGPGRRIGHDEKLEMAQHECDVKQYVTPRRSHLVDRVHRSLLTKDLEVDWELVAELAGLDDAETTVMLQQAMGLGRKLALEGCFGVADRRIISAAWRRFDRAKKTIRRVLETGRPAGRKPDERAPKMLFLLEDDGGLKIFFAKNVPGGEEVRT